MSIFNDEEILKDALNSSKEEVYKWFEQNCMSSKSIRDPQGFSVVDNDGKWIVSSMPIVYRIFINANIPYDLFRFHDINSSFGNYKYDKNSNITSMIGFPIYIAGDFDISYKGYSLEDCPQTVGQNFILDADNIKSLKGMPSTIGGDMNIKCNIKNFEGFVKKCNNVYIDSYELESFYGLENCQINNLNIKHSKIKSLKELENTTIQSLKISFNSEILNDNDIKPYIKNIPLVIINDKNNSIIFYKNERIR